MLELMREEGYLGLCVSDQTGVQSLFLTIQVHYNCLPLFI